MRGGESSQFYLPYFEADVKDSKQLQPVDLNLKILNYYFRLTITSNAVRWSNSYTVLLGIYHLLWNVSARCQKRVQRILLPLDDLHDTCGFISSCLWSLDHHWILHCKSIPFKLDFQSWQSYFICVIIAVECICFHRQLDMDGCQCKLLASFSYK